MAFPLLQLVTQINKEMLSFIPMFLFFLACRFSVSVRLSETESLLCVGEVTDSNSLAVSDWDAALWAREGCSGSSALTNQSAQPPHWRHRLLRLTVYSDVHALLREVTVSAERRRTVRFCQQTMPSSLSCSSDLLTVQETVPGDK